jgi:hypothetical protein
MKNFSLLALFLALLAVPAAAQMQPPIPMSPAEFSNAAVGQQIKLVVRVAALKRTALSAELLNRESDSLYKGTGKLVSFYLPEDTPFVMGSLADVKPGAVLFLYGTATTPGHADVKKVVALTAYVKVE